MSQSMWHVLNASKSTAYVATSFVSTRMLKSPAMMTENVVDEFLEKHVHEWYKSRLVQLGTMMVALESETEKCYDSNFFGFSGTVMSFHLWLFSKIKLQCCLVWLVFCGVYWWWAVLNIMFLCKETSSPASVLTDRITIELLLFNCVLNNINIIEGKSRWQNLWLMWWTCDE